MHAPMYVCLHCTLSLAAQCIVIGPVCGFVSAGGRAVSVSTITQIACIDFHQTGSVGEGSDHLQLIKFWPSCGANFFGSALLRFLISFVFLFFLFYIYFCTNFILIK